MALTLKNHPELIGLKAFLDACGTENFDKTTNFYKVTVHGVTLRLTEDREYIVEQDLFVAKKGASMIERKMMTSAAYRVRAAYSTTRIESNIGNKRLLAYRRLRDDNPEAPVFYAKSRAQGGPTPPPVMAISIIRYYIFSVGGPTKLGLDKYPEFMQLIDGIELLEDCILDEALRGKHQQRSSPISAAPTVAPSVILSVVPSSPPQKQQCDTPLSPPPPPAEIVATNGHGVSQFNEGGGGNKLKKALEALQKDFLILKMEVENLVSFTRGGGGTRQEEDIAENDDQTTLLTTSADPIDVVV